MFEFPGKISVNEQSSIRIACSQILYFDPFHITGKPHDADFIFLTHEHYDHFSAEDIEKVRKEETVFFAPESMIGIMKPLGVDEDHYLLFREGDKRILFDLEIEAVAAYNPSKPYHPHANEWLGYRVTVDGVTFYVTGDTDATQEAALVSCDVLLLPIGGTYTMNASEAAALTNSIKPKLAIPTHYGTIVGKKSDYEEFAKRVNAGIQIQKVL